MPAPELERSFTEAEIERLMDIFEFRVLLPPTTIQDSILR
jgi:hypothetical protein